MTFNQTIVYNKACALNKVHRNDQALKTLDDLIKMNKEYAKAYLKRGDILLELE